MVTLAFDRVTVEYRGDGTTAAVRALDAMTLDVVDGELLVVAGPSGSGKTTALRTIAGLERPMSGTVSIAGQVVNGLRPGDRDVALVSQFDTVFPHLSVEDNLAFALRLRRMPADETARRVRAEARTLGLWQRLRRRPAQLSTGERQKVALGRATTRRPRVFLFDEPLSGLDAGERNRLRREIRRLQQGLGVTTVYVTHDQRDAMAMGDRIAVLDEGRVVQVDTPMALYRRPANLFMATFLGTPPMGVVSGPLRDDGSTAWIDLGGVPLRLHPSQRRSVRAHVEPDARIAVAVRPSAVDLVGGERREWTRTLPTVVTTVEPVGPSVVVSVRPDGTGPRAHGRLYALTPPSRRPVPGQRHEVTIDLRRSFLFDAVSGAPLSTPLGK